MSETCFGKLIPVCSELEESDKLVLMRAVAGIVLRKDLSLSRRLYAWLLGPDSSTAETQKTFFTKHGLDLLDKSLLVSRKVDVDLALTASDGNAE